MFAGSSDTITYMRQRKCSNASCTNYLQMFSLFGVAGPTFSNYRITSNRSWVSNTSRGSDFICSNSSRVTNISRGRSKGEYTARLAGLPGISLCSIKYKTKNIDVLNTCSSVNWMVLIETRSLIKAGGLTLLF